MCVSPFKFIREGADFVFAMVRKRPYFGLIYRAGQIWQKRMPIMQGLINQELGSSTEPSFKILEIGSWAGSSALLWASACRKKTKGIVFCIDTWEGSTSLSTETYKKTLKALPGNKEILAALKTAQEMKRAIKNNRIFRLFLHNIEASGLKDYIILLKGSSDKVVEILKRECFDFIYVDGDHAYAQFKRDLLNYMGIAKIGGIICGDDLELFPEEVDIENAKKHSEKDWILDSRSNKYFHPGILLGIKEVFGSVSMKNGFWAMRKTKDGWAPVTL